MTEALSKRIQDLDDFRVMRFYEHFAQTLFDGLDVDTDELLAQVPEELRMSPELAPLVNLTGPGRRNALKFDDAALCARETLLTLAKHPGFEAALAQALDEYRDDAMVADIILAVGMAASMIIVAATTSIRCRYANGKFEFEFGKTVASPKMVTSIVSSLASPAHKVQAAADVME